MHEKSVPEGSMLSVVVVSNSVEFLLGICFCVVGTQYISGDYTCWSING